MTTSNLNGDREPTDQSTKTRRTEFNWTDVAPSIAVIEVIAEASGRDPTALEPLYESVDPDALDRLIRGNGVGPNERMLAVSFSFAGYTVAVRSNGFVELNQDF